LQDVLQGLDTSLRNLFEGGVHIKSYAPSIIYPQQSRSGFIKKDNFAVYLDFYNNGAKVSTSGSVLEQQYHEIFNKECWLKMIKLKL
jgi:hypothetical protein